MKIGFIGPGGSGKTTVMKIVAELLGLKPLESVVRSVFAEWGVTEADQLTWDADKKWKLQQEIFDRRTKLDSENPEGISDRTLLDHLMYCYIRGSEAISDIASIYLEKQVIASLSEYTDLFYFPAGAFTPPHDGFRQQGLAYQMLQDYFLRGFISRWMLKVTVVAPGSPAARAEQVIKVIEKGYAHDRSE